MKKYTLEEKYHLIREQALKETSIDPLEVARSIMKEDFVSVNGPEHHFLDGAAFLVAYKNANGKVDLPSALDELAERSIKMPGAMCGYWGVCGSSSSVGAALSIIHKTTPISDDEFYKDNTEYTSSVLKLLSVVGGPRCCKRNAFLALGEAIRFVEKKYGIKMGKSKVICEYSLLNEQCIGEKCPFFPRENK